MSLSNELSSEIALAILAEKRTPQELLALRDLLFQVHDELQRMAHKTSDQPERARNQTHPRPDQPGTPSLEGSSLSKLDRI